MSIMIAPAGTPLESAEKFREIGNAFLSITPALTKAFEEFGEAATRTATSFRTAYSFTMTRRARRRMQTAFQRLDRRPALIHKGGRPRV